ncbi:hypothetical protein GYMLUDRAFT_172065 [Collybiopsis luxurians FD-317 M1]|uniref:PXA domain-containing protein n=1 Tax=Collybiopsis luxurians FD-317 M1 TaxID=944289 RepID=A0A0D0CQL7_9AGAR|nr:hypothetical protein GYMLUDRAFT_172065 [Collybiopsis luxurians FD-317 M1]
MSRRHAPSEVSNNSHTTNNLAHRSVPLSKRLLFPSAPPSSFDLPPLLLTPVPSELNAELYDFIALALRAFVQPWWTKITRYDKEFLPVITEILTHVFRTLEERLTKAHQRGDLADLVFRDIPLLITQHYRDFRLAQNKANSSYAASGALSVPTMFYASQSHMAVKPGGELDLVYVRFLVDHILKTCLPKQDWDPEPERVIVREIIVKIVANDIFGKITQPWFIEKMILEQLMSIPKAKPKDSTPHPNTFSMHSILVFVLTLIQSISGACLALAHAYKQSVVTIKEVNQYSEAARAETIPPPLRTSSPSPPQVDIDPLSVSQTPSERSAQSLKPSDSSIASVSPEPTASGESPLSADANKDLPHDYAALPLLMVAEIFSTNSRFASNTIISTAGMATSQGVAGKWLDKFLPYFLTRTLSTSLLLNITRTAKRTLFPNGYPAPPPIDPTPEEQAETRRRLVHFLDDSCEQPLESKECNAHLIILLLDRILGVLFPELFEGT